MYISKWQIEMPSLCIKFLAFLLIVFIRNILLAPKPIAPGQLYSSLYRIYRRWVNRRYPTTLGIRG